MNLTRINVISCIVTSLYQNPGIFTPSFRIIIRGARLFLPLFLVCVYAFPLLAAEHSVTTENNLLSSGNRETPYLLPDLLASPTGSVLTNPNITVRFSSPDYNCLTEEYCVDVEFQSDQEDQELFGMNVRFFYEDLVLEFINFRDFQGGYGPVAPNPPSISTSIPSFGYDFFRFGEPGNAPADWVNGAIQLVDEGQPPIYISTTGWTKLFQICFSVDDPDPDSVSFCPPIVWDLEEDPANGGFLPGDDGVVIIVVDPQTGTSEPSSESVVQFNWAYSGGGSAPPYGAPTETDCIPFSCGINVVCPANTSLDCGESTLPSNTGTATSDDHCPGTPLITYADSIVTGTCGQGNFIYRTWMATDSCANVSTCQQVITLDVKGQVCGTVYNDLGQPVPDVELRMMVDVNGNQTVDAGDTLHSVVFTDSITGGFCFTLLEPCMYVIQEVLPAYHQAFSDFDQTPDPDGDDSADGADGEIPVDLAACESDLGNDFVLTVCPGIFPVLPPDTICENESVNLEIEDLNIGLLTYYWTFGSGSTPVDGFGLGPHEVSYSVTSQNQAEGADVNLTISKSGCPDTTAQITEIIINPFADATINGSTSDGCYFADRLLQPVQPEIPGATYLWDFGTGAHPATASGYGPHAVYYDVAGPKTVSLIIYPNAPGAQCPDSSTLTFTIINCPGSIAGNVKSATNEGIGSVNLLLYADADTNGIADNNVALKNVFTNSAGNYSMASLTPGNYVIVQVQPNGWSSMDDGDLTDDGDIVDNSDSLDNIIPVTITPLEIDLINYFKESPLPGNIAGYVFNDFDGDEFPDAGEGMEDVLICLFPDSNADGHADTLIAFATQVTSADGSYLFSNIPVGHYVLCEIQPEGFFSIKDVDISNDNDLVPNTNLYNDTIPVTLTNAETDEHNYFIDTDSCGLVVNNTNDAGPGSFRAALACASSGDTIRFNAQLSGQTITITSSRFLMDKNLVIYGDVEPRVCLSSQITGFFEILEGSEVTFRQLDIISGLSGNNGAAFENEGILIFDNTMIRRNPLLPTGEYLIYNLPVGEVIFGGNCFLKTD